MTENAPCVATSCRSKGGAKRRALDRLTPIGLEPTTCGLGNRRSIQLSYGVDQTADSNISLARAAGACRGSEDLGRDRGERAPLGLGEDDVARHLLRLELLGDVREAVRGRVEVRVVDLVRVAREDELRLVARTA